MAFLLVGENAIEKAKNLLGDEDPAEAKLKNPTSLRSIYGLDKVHNGFHVSESRDCVVRVSVSWLHHNDRGKTTQNIKTLSPILFVI